MENPASGPLVPNGALQSQIDLRFGHADDVHGGEAGIGDDEGGWLSQTDIF